MLDGRLKMCFDMVSGEGTACDVGTDHAYLATELIKSGKCKKVIASDVKSGPLLSAKATVEKYDVADSVELVRSDGLDEISLDGVSDIVIAGMGSETIISILEKKEELKKSEIRLILQPMKKPEILRKWLYDNNFAITCEKLAQDGDKFYVAMLAEWSGEYQRLTETEAIAGLFDENDPLTHAYRNSESNRLKRVSSALEKGGMHSEAVHISSIGDKLSYGVDLVSINQVYDYLNELYPVSLQEKWDNSGLLVENYDMECSKVMLTLDISISTIYEAECKGVDLIISHHPIIFDPLSRISKNSPVFRLIDSEISAICMHTNLDIAEGGTNGVILRKLSEKFDFSNKEPFEEIDENKNLGWICDFREPVNAMQFGETLKEIFKSEYIRVNRYSPQMISRVAFCSGSGGSMLKLAMEKKCDALITGDVKHDVWIDANNNYFALYDCGHFHTENIVLEQLRCVLEEKFPRLDITVAESSIDPVIYI